MTHEENLNQHSDLVYINNLGEKNSIIIYAHQLNQYYHTLLGNPFQRLIHYNSHKKQYEFYRTPGILNYIITYYLHHGCLSTDINYPPEILYDELVFFDFNIQIIYEVLSNIITINYYIPSGKHRRAFWYIFNSEKLNSIRIISGIIFICSFITSLSFIERIYIKKTLITEILILIFSFIELVIQYFIHPKFPTIFFLFINFFALIPLVLFLFIWPNLPTWLYNLFVIQFAARIFRSLRLSSFAYEIISALTEHLSIYFELFQSISLVILFFALITLSFEQISSPVQFLLDKHLNNQSLSDIIWISVNAYTSLGEGTSRPLTIAGLIIEFLICFIGVLTIPQLVQIIYTIVSNTIDKYKLNNKKREKTHLVLIEDEYGNKAIGEVKIDKSGRCNLPEILIEKNEFD